MTRLTTINFQEQPFQGHIANIAEQGYQGYFHSHPGIELLYIHQGHGTVTIPQHVYRIEPGTLFIFQPYQLHHVNALHTEEDPYIRTVLSFDPVELQPYLKPYKRLDLMLNYIWKNQMQEQAFTQMHMRHPIESNLLYYKEREICVSGKDERYASLVALLLQYLQEEIDSLSIMIDNATPRSMSHTEFILRWIEEHYAEPYELGRIAEELHLSKYHVSHLFKEETGRTVTDYILALRSKEACRLLMDTSLTVAEIGIRVGWPIASHFSQQFKRWVGCTPLQYRKRNSFRARQ